MEYFTTYKLFFSGVVSWFFAQIIKAIIEYYKTNKYAGYKIFAVSGGMPSAHSAMVMSILVGTGFEVGVTDPIFMVMMCFAFIVLHDAVKVRYQVGEQAKILNQLIKMKNIDGPKFNENVGHTIIEVLAGMVLGSLVSYIMFNFI